jgi:Zn-dependent protease with chaperone function
MHISAFFNSWLGMYLAQSFLHSLVAALIVDTSLISWKIENPALRQRFRLLVVVLPIIMFPLYQFISPDRGSPLFRLDAVFDITRWLNLEIWGVVPVGFLFLLALLFTAAVFLFQELLPIVRHTASSSAGSDLDASPVQPGSPVARALEALPGSKPAVFVIDDEECVIFSSTGKEPAVYLSRGLEKNLSFDELRSALAHEIGHIRRSRRPLMVMVFLLRMLMFCNPVILMEFRRIAQEEEKICDDIAVALTGDRQAMAEVLKKFSFCETGGDPAQTPADSERLQDRIEEYSHTMMIESRISRLEEPAVPDAQGAVVFAIVLVTILAVNYYLV